MITRSLFSSAILALVASVAVQPALAASDSDEIEHARSIIREKLETERTGIDIKWKNPKSGSAGKMRINDTRFIEDDIPCRWYEWSLSGTSNRISTKGKGCRIKKDVWLLEESTLIRQTVRVTTAAKTKPTTASKPKDPMAGVRFTRPGGDNPGASGGSSSQQ